MKIGFLGVGNMASAIIRGISDKIGYENIFLYDVDKSKCTEFISNGSAFVSSQSELFTGCDYVFLSVKPQQFKDAVLSSYFINAKCTVISIMAGITVATIKSVVGDNIPIIRAMPNAPMMNKLGAVGICRDSSVSDDSLNTVKELLSSVAIVKEIDEDKMSVITALSGSGPAYYYLFTKYIAEYAIEAGLDKETAELFAAQTALGAADTMVKRPHEIDELIRIVRSPNGTTEKALISFDESNLKDVVSKALIACEKRSDELSEAGK